LYFYLSAVVITHENVRWTFSVFYSQAATCYYQSNHSKVEAILL